MGFFDQLKKEISQAVTELVSDEEILQEENEIADTSDAEEENVIEEEYFDEDDYIETEEDYSESDNDMGVVVDDFASDEYVNTLNIDIAELVKSYSDEMTESEDVSFAQASMFVEREGYGMKQDDDSYEQDTLDEEEDLAHKDDANEDFSDDVMVNTLDEDFSDDELFDAGSILNSVLAEDVEEKSERGLDLEEVVVTEKQNDEAEQVLEDIVSEDESDEEKDVEEALKEYLGQEQNQISESDDELHSDVENVSVIDMAGDVSAEVVEPVDAEQGNGQQNERVNSENAVVDEVALISESLIVKGDLVSRGSINILGSVEGNVRCNGKLAVSGSIYGNIEAEELFSNGAHISGNIACIEAVKIGQGSVIVGNIYGTSAVVAGAVKGDIDIHGPVVVDSSAVVVGDIKSETVQINVGAIIEGRCSQCYAEVSPTSFFKEN